MNWFATNGDGGHRAAGTRPGGDQMNGNAVMFEQGRILCLGGGRAYDSRPATNAASIVTLNGKQASARAIGGMAHARSYAMSVVLPDGKVVTIGGMPLPKPFFDTDAVMEPGATLPALVRACLS
jgi:galactose oxidase